MINNWGNILYECSAKIWKNQPTSAEIRVHLERNITWPVQEKTVQILDKITERKDT